MLFIFDSSYIAKIAYVDKLINLFAKYLHFQYKINTKYGKNRAKIKTSFLIRIIIITNILSNFVKTIYKYYG
jgi:hypothetical protein